MRRALGRTVALVLLATALFAQRGFGQFGRGFRGPVRLATAASFDGRFNFCRGMYNSGRRDGSGGGWTTDYPDADINFSIRLSELTKTHVSRLPNGDPNHVVVRLDGDPFLFQCPIVIMTDVGELSLNDAEAANLRQYFDKGGFVWFDDFWGSYAWEAFEAEIAKVLPPDEFPIRDVALSHPIFRTLFEVAKVPQIPSINSWRGMGGGTSELGDDSAVPTMHAIVDQRGRMIVLITHNTDINDSWEREGDDPQYFYNFSPDGYAVGLNVVLYAITH